MNTTPGNQHGSRLDETHPPSLRMRSLRGLRGLRGVLGWRRMAGMFTPPTVEGAFVVANHAGGRETFFAGNLSSFIDRQMYLFGEYEGDQMRAFIDLLPKGRRGTLLDIGANVGTHAIAFAHSFGRVHSFEPNARLWENFEKNIAINKLPNVVLHRIGLADRDEELPLFLISKDNFGLGTFSTVEQYDLPLEASQNANVVSGDHYLSLHQIDRVDAIKLDVQGFEPEVLRGLNQTLARDKPVIWLEVGGVTQNGIKGLQGLKEAIPYEFSLLSFTRRRTLVSRMVLEPVATESISEGDYVVVPRT